MPYNYKKRNYRKRYRKKPYNLPFRYKVADVAYKGFKLAKSLASKMNVEYNFHDASVSSVVGTTGIFSSLGNIAQGDDIEGRTGRSILVKSLYLRCRTQVYPTAVGTLARWIVFIDNDSSGATPTAADLLDTESLTAPLQIGADQGRFRVLADWVDEVTTYGRAHVFKKKYFKLNHHIKYDGTAATDYSRGNIWVYRIASDNTNTPTMAFEARMRYVDN